MLRLRKRPKHAGGSRNFAFDTLCQAALVRASVLEILKRFDLRTSRQS